MRNKIRFLDYSMVKDGRQPGETLVYRIEREGPNPPAPFPEGKGVS
jgi:hypothetical protein